MRNAAILLGVLLVMFLTPFTMVMFLGAPPPFTHSGNGGCDGKPTMDTTVTGATTTGGGGLPANWKAIFGYLTGHGYSQNAAAGIDGNIQSESGGNPEQLEIGGGGGGGLLQWTPWRGRAQITGNVAADLAQQLGEILVYNNAENTATPGIIATLNAEPTAAAAAAFYESAFEHPLSLADAGARGANATAVLAAVIKGGGGGGMVTTVSVPAPQCPAPGTGGAVPVAATGKAATAIAFARAQLGKPYVWGGTGPDGFDCSGLVMMAWRAAGVNIPRTSEAQWAGLPHVPAGQVKPGDLVFFPGSDGTAAAPGHVAMVLGGEQMIQAYSTGTPIEISPLNGNGAGGIVGYARP